MTTTAPPKTRGLPARVLSAGASGVAASAIAALLPLIGRLYLSDDEYAVWALCATVATMGLVLDFGAPALAARTAAQGRLSGQALRSLIVCSVAGSAVLGLAAAAVWPLYARQSQLDLGVDVGLITLLLVTAGTSLRSATMVLAAACLGHDLHKERGALLLAPAFLQVAVLLLALEAGAGVHALGVAALGSGALGVVLSAHLGRRLPAASQRDSAMVAQDLSRFVRTKAVAVVAGLLLTQMDRWVLGLTASASTISTYDLAARLASLPKLLLLTLGVALLSEGARAQATGEQRQALLAESTRLAARLVLLGSSLVVVAAVALEHLRPAIGGAAFTALLLAMLTWHGVHAMTAPGLMILTGLGRPDYELRYLVPTTALGCLSYGLGVALQSTTVVVVGLGASILLCSAYFVVRAGSYVRSA